MSNANIEELNTVNMLGSGNLGVEVDLSTLAEDLTATDVSYEPERFPGAHIKFDENGPVCNLYSSGKYTIVGAQSDGELHSTQTQLIQKITNLGILSADFIDEDFGVRNIVYTYDLGRELDLNALSIKFGLENVEYEPEQSPFLVYKPECEGETITIPSNGRIMITGVITEEDAVTGVNKLLDNLNGNDTSL